MDELIGRWEYRIIEESDLYDESVYETPILDSLGREGWELAAKISYERLVFKRPLIDHGSTTPENLRKVVEYRGERQEQKE